VKSVTDLPPGIRVAGESSDIKSLLFQYSWHLKKQGYADSTIETRFRILKVLSKRGANLLDPESVKHAISVQKWVPKRKMNAVDAYTHLVNLIGITWRPPRYQVTETLPFIPTEKELDDLIAGSGPKTTAFLLLLKETAMRCGEAHKLRWEHIDFERRTIRVTPEKGSNPRIFKVSNRLINMLSHIKSRNNVEDPNRIFAKKLRNIRRVFSLKRNSLARKLQNPRLKQISFHTFRHWKATMLYHQTKDLLRVQQFLGHKSIANTLKYIQIEEALFQDVSDEYVCKTAVTVDEATELIELGFKYVTEIDGMKLFKKPKALVGEVH